MLESSLVNQIYDIVKERIVSLQLKQGEKIDVQKLAKEFGVSQTPIRDALNRLSQNSLVNTRARVGYYVVDLSAKDITEIYDLRKMFECYALQSAIENIKFNELRQLRRKMEKIQRETDERTTEFNETDKEIHSLIIKNSNNKRLQSLFSQIYDFARISISMGIKRGRSLKEHIALIGALQEKDLARADGILKEHINNSRDDAIKVLENKYSKKDKRISLSIK